MRQGSSHLAKKQIA